MTPYQRKAVSLVENGYAILPIQSGEKRPTFNGWRQYQATVERIEREWQGNGNIGILTDRTPAIDIDIKDEAMALEMERVVLDLLGDAPVRVGMAPKRLLVFRTNTPFRKVDSGFFTDAEGVQHKVEVLGEGQQFVAFGIHPDTRKPYRWVSLESPGDDLHAEDLPLLTADDARTVVEAFIQRAEARGWVRASAAASGPAGADEFWFLRPKPEATDEEVEEAVRLFPNPGRDYDLWIKVGAALHDHYAGDERGFSLWDQWSSRSSLYEEVLTRRKWDSFGRYTGQPVTIGFLLAATRAERKKAEVAEAVAGNASARSPLIDAIRSCNDPEALVGDLLAQAALANLDALNEELVVKEIAARRKALKATEVSARTLKKKLADLRGTSQKDVEAGLGMLLEKAVADKVLEMKFDAGARLMFFSDLWWVYAGGVWRRTEENMVAKAAQDAVLQLQSEQDPVAMKLASELMESRGDRLSGLVANIVSTMKRIVGEDGMTDPLNLCADQVPRVINCANGELWFDLDGTFRFRKHDPESRLTSQVACKYDPKATCPTWDAMLSKVFQSCLEPEEVARHFDEVFGYMLQPERHQAAWVMFKGPGGNGKSTLLGVIRSLMGPGAVLSHSIAELTNGANTHFTDSAQGKLMLLDDDFKAGGLLPDDWLKKFSEAKGVTANPKFGRQYSFTARCTPVILSNVWPSTVDLTEGLRRRALVFETNHVLTAEEKNPRHLQEVLRSELPGVLNRLIAGLVRVLQRGQRFAPPAECEASKQKWITMSNPTARFVSTVVQQTGDKADIVRQTDLFDAYRQWVQFDESNSRPLGRNKFYEAMESMGLRRRNHSGVLVFVGLRVRVAEGVETMFHEN